MAAMSEARPLFLGIHLAGPNLNPVMFHTALFSSPPVGGATQGFVTTWASAYSRAGTVWPWDNYSSNADFAEGWFDPTTTGPDEGMNPGKGVYRSMNGGKRHPPSPIPSGEPNAL